ncbi:MAG: hypothetical protein VX426_01080 [Chloroflexota bacterium]|nr:hypothetical protein [Chloroflexota bacterium]
MSNPLITANFVWSEPRGEWCRLSAIMGQKANGRLGTTGLPVRRHGSGLLIDCSPRLPEVGLAGGTDTTAICI